ncbi:hypothetical protein [Chromobacterium phragmitis]|uniref:DUF4145 domain-containing protein n=1 Tax=Chromobacterium phragmitis TaxID=2202141 RepID=A0ABV0IV83_9NEIS
METKFNIGKWHGKLIIEPNNFETLIDYTSNKKHLAAYAENRDVLDSDGEIKSILQLAHHQREILTKTISEDIEKMAESLSRQMIIIAQTYIESMLTEFLECFFYKNPSHAHKFISINGLEGVVHLTVILNSHDMPSLFRQIATSAAREVMRGKFETSVRTIEKTTKVKIDSTLRKKLIEICNERNNIIHEAKEPIIDTKYVKEVFDCALFLLTAISHCAVEQKIPITDPGHLVTEYTF